jgi:hypothetical protein
MDAHTPLNVLADVDWYNVIALFTTMLSPCSLQRGSAWLNGLRALYCAALLCCTSVLHFCAALLSCTSVPIFNQHQSLPQVSWRWVKEGDGHVRHEARGPYPLPYGVPILLVYDFSAAADAEQLEIEMRFRKSGSLRSMYWIGLEKSGNLYYWQDRSRVNNGNVSNEDPCKSRMWHHCYSTTWHKPTRGVHCLPQLGGLSLWHMLPAAHFHMRPHMQYLQW